MPDNMPCVEGNGDCAGPLARNVMPPKIVCNECAEVYERMVAEGQIPDFANEPEHIPEPDDDGDYLDRKFTGKVR